MGPKKITPTQEQQSPQSVPAAQPEDPSQAAPGDSTQGDAAQPPDPGAPPVDVVARLHQMRPLEKVRLAGMVWAEAKKAPTLVIWQKDSNDHIVRKTAEDVFLALDPLTAQGPVQDLWVILNSLGGELDRAYQIARRLQEAAVTVHAVIPRMAKSAATLITMGCHEVVMHPMAELGPIDTQMHVVRDDVRKMLSTLDALKSLEYLRGYSISSFLDITSMVRWIQEDITFKGASAIGASVTKGLVEPMFARIDPIHLGEVFRALELSREYGKRLVQHSYPGLSDKDRDHLVRRLVEGYPSHSFVIDIKEATDLHLNVRAADKQERGVIEFGVQAADGQARLVELFMPPPSTK